DQLDTLLDSELGVEPMAESRALRAAILRGGPLPAESGPLADVAASLTVKSAMPALIGRDVETEMLGELWQRAEAGHGRVVTVSGDAGVGKSRLARGLADDVLTRGGLPLVGHCYEFEQALPYQAIVEMLRTAAHLLRHSDLAPAHRSALTRLVPDVLGAFGDPSGASSPDELRAQVFEALLQAFLALARSQPLLLVVEDVHWAAESTLDWLTYVAPRLAAARLLVVITHRTDEVESERPLARLHRRLARTTGVATLHLTPLSAVAHRELVTRLSGLPADVAAPLADRLFAETAGNPFFLHEIVRGLVETGRITVHDGQWDGAFVDAASSAAAPLPDTVRELITARVERLGPESRTFVQVAAVAGRVFQYGIVQRSTGWTDEPALHALEDVLARGFVVQRDLQEDFAFAHHLIQEVIYAGMTLPRRVYWHRRLTEAIQALRPDDVEALAHHFSRAGDDERARVYYVQAGDRAQQLAALDDAARLYRSALNRWPDSDPAGRADLLYKRGQCQWVLGELHAALESLDLSRALFES
ncbi:MAG: ATP-binding protein, partial [Vicinamibacterales bacterium]